MLVAISDEYLKAVNTNQLGTWQAAAISIIELYGGEDIQIVEQSATAAEQEARATGTIEAFNS